jgi:hypothetical protein
LVVEANSAFCEILECNRDALVGHEAFTLLPDRLDTPAAADWARALQTSMELAPVWSSNAGLRRWGPTGRVAGIQGDIEAHRRAVSNAVIVYPIADPPASKNDTRPITEQTLSR